MDCKLDDSRTVPGARCMSRDDTDWAPSLRGRMGVWEEGREGGKVGEMGILVTENQREF